MDLLNAVISKILIFIAMFIMPMGILLSIQGGYFYNLTTKESIGKMIDSTVAEIFQNQAKDLKPYCQTYNISCDSLNETANSVCQKTQDMRVSSDNAAASLCSNMGLSCSETETAKNAICQKFGESDIRCVQMSEVAMQLSEAENSCTQMREMQNQIEISKENAYSQKIAPFSISEINSLFANALFTGIVIFIISLLMLYFVSGSIYTVLKSIAFTLISTGAVTAFFGYFGYQFVIGQVLSQIPSEVVTSMPKSLDFIIKGIFDYEFFSGIAMIIVGIVLAISYLYLKKNYPEKEKKHVKK